MKNHYETLGIEPSANAGQIKRAYFNMVKKYPPERFPEEFKAIRAAYDELYDEKKRSAYDDTTSMPQEAAFLYRHAHTFYEQHRYKEAEDTYRTLVKLYPELSAVQVELAKSLEAQGKLGKAIEVWQAVSKKHPDRFDYVAGLADCYEQRGWRKKAISAYQRAIHLDSSDRDCWSSLIFCYFEGDEEEEGYSVIKQAIQALKNQGSYCIPIYLLAALYCMTNLLPGAEDYLKEVCRLNRQDGSESEYVVDFLQSTLELEGIFDDNPNLFLLMQDLADSLVYVDDGLRDQLEKASIDIEINELENEGFSEIFCDMFSLLVEGCRCEDCLATRNTMELYLLLDWALYRSELLRVKREHPRLYALNASFFREATLAHNTEKMISQRSKRLREREMDDFEPDEEDSEPAPQPFRREGPKVGRNDPCPCGSGKKYKKCCGA